jgi:hypothetical protein
MHSVRVQVVTFHGKAALPTVVSMVPFIDRFRKVFAVPDDDERESAMIGRVLIGQGSRRTHGKGSLGDRLYPLYFEVESGEDVRVPGAALAISLVDILYANSLHVWRQLCFCPSLCGQDRGTCTLSMTPTLCDIVVTLLLPDKEET